METQVLHFFTVLTTLGYVRGSSEVMESNASYSCCGSPTLKYNQSCDNIWTINGKPIAYSTPKSSSCSSPCKMIKDGLMTLDDCVDVNVISVCTIALKMVDEKNINYHSEVCDRAVSNKAPGNHSSDEVVLLVLLITGWCVKQMMC